MEQGKKYDVFISYRRNDTDQGNSHARVVCEAVRKAGFSYFLDKDKMPTGPFPDSIDSAIRQSRRFAFIINNDSWREIQEGKTDWYYQEIGRASVYLGLNNMTPVVVQNEEFKKLSTNHLPPCVIDYFKTQILVDNHIKSIDITSDTFRQLNKIDYSTEDNFCDQFKKHLGLEKEQASDGNYRNHFGLVEKEEPTVVITQTQYGGGIQIGKVDGGLTINK